MSNGWLDPNKYEHIPITGATGPGTMHDGYAWKFINHSTEGPPGSILGTLSLFKAKPNYCPHFMIDPMGTGRRMQHIPWTWSACALKGGSGGWQTNRGRAVQMEICGYAKTSPDWSDEVLRAIADVIADVIKDGCPINPNNAPDSTTLTGILATANAKQRMSWNTWKLFDGIGAHVYVPNNDHWDIGKANNLRIAEHVRDLLAGGDYTPGDGGTLPDLPAPPSQVTPPYVSLGMTGGAVSFIQQLLKGVGCDPGPVDGVFGPKTRSAVVAFQQQQGLTVDGVVGPETSAALSAVYAEVSGKDPIPKPPKPEVGAPAWAGRFLVRQNPMQSGGDIRRWQARMAERGWRISVDGWYGDRSESICHAFQEEKHLTVDGIVGRQTWDAAWTSPVT